MRRDVTFLAPVVMAAACVGASMKPALQFGPDTGPLRYVVTSERTSITDTPVGTQRQEGTSAATVLLRIGPKAARGLEVSAVFESLEVNAGSRGRIDGADLEGTPFTGVLTHEGVIAIDDGPDTPAPLSTVFDPRYALATLLPPLPPDAETDLRSWPVVRDQVSRSAVTATNSLRGTARLAGDTTWDGVRARVIVVDGTIEVSGGGAAPGAPGEIAFQVSGPYRARYLWDPARNVMLASTTELDATGDVSVAAMDMPFPFRLTVTSSVELERTGAR